METTTIERKTFKDVHEDILKEAMFLNQNHNIHDFKIKASFLERIGFENSIATKLYKSVSENQDVISEYQQKYGYNSKFILEPQLERVCEKYNLFVRDVNFFLGDIPEKNVRDMMKFEVDIYDLDIEENRHRDSGFGKMGYSNFVRLTNVKGINGAENLIQIAAVKDLFHESAFKFSQSRIINTAQIPPKFQVELDPIVLCKVKGGYLVITAWGDEANDELVVNQNLN